jgi:hypothetical protein
VSAALAATAGPQPKAIRSARLQFLAESSVTATRVPTVSQETGALSAPAAVENPEASAAR